MNKCNFIVICCLSIGLGHARAQSCPINVKVDITHATIASDNGAVSFEIEGQIGSKDYSIYKITSNQGNEKLKTSYQFRNLAAGIYEFVVVDHKRGKCAKEVQVKI